jgi:hypothetical protein
MKKIHLYIFLSIALLCVVVSSCRQSPQQPDIPTHQGPDVPIYTYPPQEDQPNAEPEPDAPVIPPTQDSEEDYVVRNIVVDQQNSIFSIGIPAGQSEETNVTAQEPIDFWFEYLPAETKLEVNGVEVQRDPFHWETKIGYTTSVTKFEYKISNTTGNYVSYNLHLVPSAAGESVPVVVRQRWIP